MKKEKIEACDMSKGQRKHERTGQASSTLGSSGSTRRLSRVCHPPSYPQSNFLYKLPGAVDLSPILSPSLAHDTSYSSLPAHAIHHELLRQHRSEEQIRHQNRLGDRSRQKDCQSRPSTCPTPDTLKTFVAICRQGQVTCSERKSAKGRQAQGIHSYTALQRRR